MDLCSTCLVGLLARDWAKLEQLRNPKPTRAPRKAAGTRKASSKRPGPGMKAPPVIDDEPLDDEGLAPGGWAKSPT